MKSIKGVQFKGKKVLIRVDYNVPLNEHKEVSDDTRIRQSLKTLKKVIGDGGRVILMSHLGRPKGKVNPDLSLEPVARRLSELLGKEVIFSRELIGEETPRNISKMNDGDVLLLENIRFYAGEEKGDKDFAAKLAALGDVYINDAFGTAHRAHASTAVLAEFFPDNKYFGFLMENEIVNLDKVLHSELRPFTAVIGGAKVSTKIDIIRQLISRVDTMIIGGGMVFTFIKALGGSIGSSLYEEDKVEEARETLLEMLRQGVRVILPTDVVAADRFSNDARRVVVGADAIPEGWMGLDVGPQTNKAVAQALMQSGMILWNGPMGVFEMEHFQAGTKAVAVGVGAATMAGAFSAVGGGDSVAAVNKYDMADMMSFVSTGGGAMLEYIEGKKLPGIRAIEE